MTNDKTMKLPRTTLILILLALGLGSFVYFYEIRGATQREEIKEQKQQIFSFGVDDVQTLTVTAKKLTLNLERSNQSGDSKWLIKSPISEPANDAIVSYLMDLLVKGKSDRTLLTPAKELGQFGLDQPQTTINITLKNKQNHQLLLGKNNFNGRFLYAQADPTIKPDGNVNVLLVSTDFTNAVNRELSEWKQPVDNIKSTPLPSTLPLPSPTNSK
jgi:ribosomal protein L23